MISFLVTGIILSSNWNYFIQNNDNNNHSLSSYQLNINNSIYDKYNQEGENIIFQINVLTSAISKNNIMYQKYNNIFKHNVNFVRLQRNIIRNRINLANSSIKHEIDILSNMKNIINNHPYNYLKFFQSKNYILPQIVSQKTLNSSQSLNNIRTYSQNINSNDTTVKDISYQSEEAIIGIGDISSFVTSAETLVFSKIHFDYNSLYYFSNVSDNLSTVNQTINNVNIINKATAVKNINKFISNKKSNETVIKTYDREKAAIALSNLFYRMKRNKNMLLLASTAVTINFIFTGVIGILVFRSVKKYIKNIERVTGILENAYDTIPHRTMSLQAYKKQVIRYAQEVKESSVSKPTITDIERSLSGYIRLLRQNTKNSDIYSKISKNVDIYSVKDSTLRLSSREATTEYGWYKLPVFEENKFDGLTNAQKIQIKMQIKDLEDLIGRLPTKKAENMLIYTKGREIATEIFQDLRQVAFVHLEHLQKYKTNGVKLGNKGFTTASDGLASEPVITDFVAEFWETTLLIKNNPAETNHIEGLGTLEEHLGDISRFGLVE